MLFVPLSAFPLCCLYVIVNGAMSGANRTFCSGFLASINAEASWAKGGVCSAFPMFSMFLCSYMFLSSVYACLQVRPCMRVHRLWFDGQLVCMCVCVCVVCTSQAMCWSELDEAGQRDVMFMLRTKVELASTLLALLAASRQLKVRIACRQCHSARPK